MKTLFANLLNKTLRRGEDKIKLFIAANILTTYK